MDHESWWRSVTRYQSIHVVKYSKMHETTHSVKFEGSNSMHIWRGCIRRWSSQVTLSNESKVETFRNPRSSRVFQEIKKNHKFFDVKSKFNKLPNSIKFNAVPPVVIPRYFYVSYIMWPPHENWVGRFVNNSWLTCDGPCETNFGHTSLGSNLTGCKLQLLFIVAHQWWHWVT